MTNAPTLFKQVDYSLSKLIVDIEMGEIGLPDIQRPFVWTPVKVRNLFDSMFKGFPVGYLLFWANGVDNGTRHIGTDHKQKIPRLLIVDGQQRLTSLYAVMKDVPILNDDYIEKKISIAFKPKDSSFEVTDAGIKKSPEWIPDISVLWASQTSRNRFVKDFINNLKKTRPVDENEEDYLVEAIDRLYDLQNYPFTAMELSSNVDEEQVADVFVRINSQGITLNVSDFILTLMSVFWDDGRKNLEDFCRSSRIPTSGKPSSYNHFIEPDPDELLRVSVALGFRRARLKNVYSILRGKDLETEQFSEEQRIKQFRVLKEAQAYTLDLIHWHEFLKTLVRAGFRSGKMITSKLALMYSYAMYLIGTRDFKVEHHELRDIIAKWFFMASTTGRYSGSPESIMEMDLNNLRGLKTSDEFRQTLEKIIDDTLTADFWSISLPNELASSAARSPSLFAYHASLNLLDAPVLFSSLKVSELLDPALISKKSSIESHHLFPKNYLKSIGITETVNINQIANLAMLEWPDNIDISDMPPKDYLPKFKSKLTKEMSDLHALPEGWENMDYTDFLEKRRKLIASVTRKGFEKI